MVKIIYPKGAKYTREQQQKAVDDAVAGFKRIGSGVKRGVKAVGGAVKKALTYPAKQLEKEWRGEDEEIERKRKKMRDEGWTN